jgi:HK97 family phage major capsid protein
LAEEFSNQVMEELELDLKVESLFTKIRMPNNRSTFSIPAKTEKASAYLIAPGDDAIESALNGSKISFATKRLKTLLGVTDQADQEMVTAIINLVKQELVKSLARASEDAIVMGDTSIDDSNSPKKAFDGLLKLAKDAGNKVDAVGNAINVDAIAKARKVLGVYGIRPADVVIVAPVDVAYQMLTLQEVITVDKYGAKATLLTGEIGRIFGMPIVVTEYIPNTLDANGDDGSGDGHDKTAALLVNKNYFAVADRGQIGLETERKAVSSTTLYVAYRDIDFKKLCVNNTPVSAIVNIDPTK